MEEETLEKSNKNGVQNPGNLHLHINFRREIMKTFSLWSIIFITLGLLAFMD